MTYFDSGDCTGDPSPNGEQTKLTGGSFTIRVGSNFALEAQSLYNVGNNNSVDMSQVNSIAIVFPTSNTADVPQSDFSGSNYHWLPVTCSSGECTGSRVI